MATAKKPAAAEENRKELSKLLIGAIITALFGIIATSATVLYESRDRLDRITYDYKSFLDKQGIQMPIGLEFEKLVTESGHRLLDRARQFQPQWTNTDWLSSAANRVKVHEISAMARSGAAADLGRLSGYSPQVTGLDPSFHNAAEKSLGTEIEFWKALDGLADNISSPTAEQQAFERWSERTDEMTAATNRQAKEAENALKSWMQQVRLESDQRQAEFQRQMNGWHRDLKMATVGVCAGAIGMMGLLMFIWLRRP
jgi:hypothetical protein